MERSSSVVANPPSVRAIGRAGRTGPPAEPVALADKLRLARLFVLLAVVTLLAPGLWLVLDATAPAGAPLRAALLVFAAGALGAGGIASTCLLLVRRANRRLTRLGECAALLARQTGAEPEWRDEVETVALGVARLSAQSQATSRQAASLATANRALAATLRRLEAADRRHLAILDQLPHGVLVLDTASRVVACNTMFRALFALPGTAVQPGELFGAALAATIAGSAYGRADLAALADLAAQVLQEGAPTEQRHAAADGRSFVARWSPLADGTWMCICEDITDRRLSERRIAHMARHDPLTGLPNRVAVRDALHAAFARVHEGERLWVHCIDLDRVRQINDTLGRAAGDEVLREAARRLRAAVREEDTPGHLGSDEFVVVQADRGQADAAGTLARRLIEVLGHPYDVAGEAVLAGASIGIAVVEAQERDPDAVLRRATLALDRAKLDGRGTSRFYERDMDTAARRRREFETDLRRALDREQFELFYQPLVSVRERRVCGFEALLRWRHPTRGMIPPAQFIPLAEELRLIVPIGEWVLRTACAAAMQWPESVAVAINLSPAQFLQPGLFDTVRAALEESGLPASRLELEITESVLLADNEATLDVLHTLRAMGVRISMDDFGTGYSSLSYLRSFPFDKLKIDKSFISGIDRGEENAVIVRTIAALGESLGIATTAEGVETREQLDQLVLDGCTEVQGYFFSPPCPAADIPQLLVEIAVRGATTAEPAPAMADLSMADPAVADGPGATADSETFGTAMARAIA